MFVPIDVPDGTGADCTAVGTSTPVNANITVSQFAGAARVAAVKVGVTLRHTYRSDLKLTLIAPADPMNGGQSRKVVLYNHGGANCESTNDIDELFDISSPSAESLDQLGDAMSAPANGIWSLKAEDTVTGDVGQITDFRIYIKQK